MLVGGGEVPESWESLVRVRRPLMPFVSALPGFVVVAGVGVVIGITQAITWRRFQAGAIARANATRDE